MQQNLGPNLGRVLVVVKKLELGPSKQRAPPNRSDSLIRHPRDKIHKAEGYDDLELGLRGFVSGLDANHIHSVWSLINRDKLLANFDFCM